QHDTSMIYLLSLHDALPISEEAPVEESIEEEPTVEEIVEVIPEEEESAVEEEQTNNQEASQAPSPSNEPASYGTNWYMNGDCTRSEEHTSELQSRFDLVCRL